MPIRHRPDFKEALSTLRRLKNKRIELITKIGGLGGNGKIPGGIPYLRHNHDDGLDTDRAGKPVIISEWSTYLWNDSHNKCGAKVSMINWVTANAVYCHRREV